MTWAACEDWLKDSMRALGLPDLTLKQSEDILQKISPHAIIARLQPRFYMGLRN